VDGSPAKDQKGKKIQSESSPVHLPFSPIYNPLKSQEREQNWKAPPMLLSFSTQIYSHKTHKNQRKEFADCQTFQTDKVTQQLEIWNATARSDSKNTAWKTKDL
jgi:hypothetical protein